jgi:hypothetical protein
MNIASLLRTAAATVTVLGALASPAAAATKIQHPSSYVCSNATVAVAPARVWATPGRTEQVVWLIQLDRWNGRAWKRYSQVAYVGSFNHFGMNVTGWSMYNTRTGGRFINSRMNVPVSHRGYYRVASGVSAPGLSSAVYVGGARAYCTIR